MADQLGGSCSFRIDNLIQNSGVGGFACGKQFLLLPLSTVQRSQIFFFCFNEIHRKTSLPAVCIISPVYHIYFCRILQQFSWVHPRGITGREDSVKYTTESKNPSTYIDKKVL